MLSQNVVKCLGQVYYARTKNVLDVAHYPDHNSNSTEKMTTFFVSKSLIH